MSKTRIILHDLLSGKRISTLDGVYKYNTVRLGGIIFHLRKHGYDIKTEIKKNPRTKSIYAEYFI